MTESDSPAQAYVHLVEACRDEHAKRLIKEAVLAYSAGAYRASIISTWIAVVFDVISKVRELELVGEPEAIRLADEVRNIQSGSNVSRSLKLEQTILEIAETKLEFISSLQRQQLTRLQEDRNLSAHPTYSADDETFQPTAAQAMMHVENAVNFLLSHPAVQGQSALDRLLREADSDYFPTRPKPARIALQEGPLKNGKKSLVRSYIVVLLKRILLEPSMSAIRAERHTAALSVALDMHDDIAQECLRNKLGSLVNAIEDPELIRLVTLVRRVPTIANHLTEAQVQRLQLYVSAPPETDRVEVFQQAFRVSFLKGVVQSALPTLPIDSLIDLQQEVRIPGVLDRIVQSYVESENFREANDIGLRGILPITAELSSDLVVRVLDGFLHNSQLAGSNRGTQVISAVLRRAASNQDDDRAFRDGIVSWLNDLDVVDRMSSVARQVHGIVYGTDSEDE